MSNVSTTTAQVSGAYVMWDVVPTQYGSLLERLTNIGLEKYCPPPRSPNAALRKALGDYAAQEKKLLPNDDSKKRDMVVQPLKKREDGFEVVEVARDHKENDYRPRFSAKVEITQDGNCESVIVTRGYASTYRIDESYRKYRQEIEGSDVGRSLVNLLQHFHGTCVRTVGGVYYLPEDAVSQWDDVVTAYESAGRNTVNRTRIVLDDSSIRTVKRAITTELTGQAGRIAEEIKSGSLGKDALANRLREAQALAERAAEYESILNCELAECQAMITLAKMAASSGTAMQDDSAVFDELYAS